MLLDSKKESRFSLFLIGLLTSLGSPDNDSDVHANSQAHGEKTVMQISRYMGNNSRMDV